MSRAHPAGPRHAELLSLPEFPPREADAARGADVWPIGTVWRADGDMELEGLTASGLADTFGTPLVVMSETDVRRRARSYVEAFASAGAEAGVSVYYAGKAFLASALVRWLRDEGLGIDVCSGGELACALAAGMPADRILMHGNNKSVDELSAALSAGVGRIVVDSADELDRLSALAGDLGVRPKVLVRATLGVEAHTHEFIATAHEDQKFGFSLASGSAMRAVRRIVGDPHLELVGIHSHIGSQIFDASGFSVAAQRAVGFLSEIREAVGVTLTELNLGGGMGIRYVAGDDPLDIGVAGPAIVAIVRRECAAADLPMPHLAFEPGRAIVGSGAVTLYRVGTVKRRTLDAGRTRTYVSVDGGMSDNIRTALYDAEYTVALTGRVSAAAPELVRVVGKHCESGDIVVRDAWLPGDVVAGDLLAVAATGAYNRSMASNYNMVPRPAVVSVASGKASVVLRRETIGDIFALDPGLASAPDPAGAERDDRKGTVT